MKKLIIICLSLFLFCGVRINADTKEDKMDIKLQCEHGRIRLEWEDSEGAQYRIILLAIDEANTETELGRTLITSNAYYGEELVA